MSHSRYSIHSFNPNKPKTDCTGKRNTSRPVFTAHERTLARAAWGSSTARLGRESFLPFASCGLCLEPAIDPVSCLHGDIFCRECALNNIVAQKKEIKRTEKVREQEEHEILEDQARQNLEAKERTVREFELTQAGLEVKVNGGAQTAKGRTQPTAKELPPAAAPEQMGGKRKREDEQFRLEQGELERISEQRLRKARKEMDDEKVGCATTSHTSRLLTHSCRHQNLPFRRSGHPR